MMEFFNRLRKVKAESQGKANSTWRKLVLSVADETKVTERETLATLEQLGRSLEDLEAAVANVKQRRVLFKNVEAAKNAKSELEAIEKEAEAAHAKFRPIETEFNLTMERLSNIATHLREVQVRSRSTVDKLIASCTDEEALAAYASAQDEDRKAQARRAAAEAEFQRLDELCRFTKDSFDKAEHPGDRDNLAAKLRTYDSQYDVAFKERTEAMEFTHAAAKEVESRRTALAECEL
jgi:hypothetical protein